MKKAVKIFNSSRVLENRLLSFKCQRTPEQISAFYQSSAETICYQLSCIRKLFSNIAIISSAPHLILGQLPPNVTPENVFLCDTSIESLSKNFENLQKESPNIFEKFPNCKIHPLAIEEELWCFRPETLDLVISHHNLHWVNNLDVSLLRILDSLKPDGALIGSVFGSDTLEELRIASTLAESERSGGISQHTNPFISIVDMGNLIARCHYNLPTVYTEKKQLIFDSCLHLMQFLQNLGENNALINKRNPFELVETIMATNAIYDNLFEYEPEEKNMKTRLVSSTFEEVYFLGWKYHESQQKPKKRGTAEFSLKDLQKEIMDLEGEKNTSKVEYGEICEEEEESKKENKDKK